MLTDVGQIKVKIDEINQEIEVQVAESSKLGEGASLFSGAASAARSRVEELREAARAIEDQCSGLEGAVERFRLRGDESPSPGPCSMEADHANLR